MGGHIRRDDLPTMSMLRPRKNPGFSRLKTWGDRAKLGVLAIIRPKKQASITSRAVITIPPGADSSMPTNAVLQDKAFGAKAPAEYKDSAGRAMEPMLDAAGKMFHLGDRWMLHQQR